MLSTNRIAGKGKKQPIGLKREKTVIEYENKGRKLWKVRIFDNVPKNDKGKSTKYNKQHLPNSVIYIYLFFTS